MVGGVSILHLASISQANIIKDGWGKVVRKKTGSGQSIRAKETAYGNSCIINYTCEVK